MHDMFITFETFDTSTFVIPTEAGSGLPGLSGLVGPVGLASVGLSWAVSPHPNISQ